MKRSIALIAALTLPACTATADQTAGTASDTAQLCKHEGLESFNGQKATADLGATLLARSSARTLRWGPPRSAMTMDFRPDRLTVSYDDDMAITSARCG